MQNQTDQSVKIAFDAPVPIGSEAYILTRGSYEQNFTPCAVSVYAYEIESNGKIFARIATGAYRVRHIPIQELFPTKSAASAAASEYLKKYGGGCGECQ